jgi:hypothetical protein
VGEKPTTSVEPKAKKKDKKAKRKRVVRLATDIGQNPNHWPDKRSHDIDPESGEDEVGAWELFEGPRFRFAWLIGESCIWTGPDHPGVGPMTCWCCGGVALPKSAYCLWCDHSGRDSEIGAPPLRRRVARRVYSPAKGLKGGVG